MDLPTLLASARSLSSLLRLCRRESQADTVDLLVRAVEQIADRHDALVAGYNDLVTSRQALAQSVATLTTDLATARAETDEARAALREYATRCDVCEERPRTRSGTDYRGTLHAVCDADDCGHVIECGYCGKRDTAGPLEGWRCAWCGRSSMLTHAAPRRVPRADRWTDCPHAAALRACEVRRG